MVVVIGSLNMDLVVRTPRLPRPGETVTARSFATFPGGKGANQAVAAARMGARVAMVGRVGQDAFGEQLRQTLQAEGVELRWLAATPGTPTGIASVWVDDDGANAIAIVPGANGELSPEDVTRAGELIRQAAVVLVQLEVPTATVHAAMQLAREGGAAVVLDPAPMRPEAAGLLSQAWAVTPNQVEAEALVGFAVETVDDGRRACSALLDAGVEVAIVKMGGHGVVVARRGEDLGSGKGSAHHIPALKVEVVDTTAAGDAFCGALAAGLAQGRTLLDACRLANATAGLSVTRPGAQPSLPRLAEVERLPGAANG